MYDCWYVGNDLDSFLFGLATVSFGIFRFSALHLAPAAHFSCGLPPVHILGLLSPVSKTSLCEDSAPSVLGCFSR
jgi:hypothetical protein